MGEMRWPRLYMFSMLMGTIVFSTWSGMAYAHKETAVHLGLGLVASVFSLLAYVRGIRPTIKD